MATAVMTSKRDFLDRNTLCRYLATQLKKGAIAPILGAGVSTEFKLPSWENLVNSLFAKCAEPMPAHTSLEQATEFLRTKHFKHKTSEFLGAVRAALYDGVSVDFRSLRKSELLGALAALMMSSHRGSAGTVVTFNFDDLLERYLEYHGFVVQSITTPEEWDTFADVTIYHPHGLLPFDVTTRPMSDDIVFDFRSYSRVVGDPTNLFHQLTYSLMRRKTCLFVGLSGRDANLDAIVGKVASVHPCRKSNTCYWGVAFGMEDEVAMRHWEERGVFYNIVNDYADIPAFLFEICQAAAAL